MSDHEYNNRDLGPIQFLRAVMRDPRVKLKHRRGAAKALADLQMLDTRKLRPDWLEYMHGWCNQIAADVAEARARTH